MMKFIVIGISDAPHPFLTPEVHDLIRQGRVFSGGKRHHLLVAEYLPADAEWIDITVPLSTVFNHYRRCEHDCGTSFPDEHGRGASSPDEHDCGPSFPDEHGRGASRFSERSIVVFASGDPLFFGFANTLRREFPDAAITVYPSFNSLQMLAHRLLMPYHDMRIVSLTGRPWPEFDRALIERWPLIGILTDREHTPTVIARRMLDYVFTSYNIYIGEHLGNPDQERVTATTLTEAARSAYAHPNCVILSASSLCGDSVTAPAPSPAAIPAPAQQSRPFGIPDSAFALLDGREKMITKMPIRLLALQALDLPSRHVLWDIGACTGSVSIEARLLFPHLRVEAFEIRPECEDIIRENAHRFGAPGINVHIGDFLDMSVGRSASDGPDIPAPDAVFIGGHGGRLKEIMARVKDCLAPGGIIVMNSVVAPKVTTDSRRLWDEACTELGLQQESPLHIQLNDNHPITILKCRK